MRAQILIVDDDHAMCWLLTRIFSKHNVKYFHDGLSAMAWLGEGNLPDLIICDYKLPNLNGNNFIIELKRSGLFRSIPVVVLSGWTGSQEVAECLDAGAEDYIFKPYDPEEFEKRITSILNTRHSRKKAGSLLQNFLSI